MAQKGYLSLRDLIENTYDHRIPNKMV